MDFGIKRNRGYRERRSKMDKRVIIFLVAIGAIPPGVYSGETIAAEMKLGRLDERTVAIVQELLRIGALYATPDGLELRISKSVLSADIYNGLLTSKQVKQDPATGDFIVNPAFTLELAKARLLQGRLPNT